MASTSNNPLSTLPDAELNRRIAAGLSDLKIEPRVFSGGLAIAQKHLGVLKQLQDQGTLTTTLNNLNAMNNSPFDVSPYTIDLMQQLHTQRLNQAAAQQNHQSTQENIKVDKIFNELHRKAARACA